MDIPWYKAVIEGKTEDLLQIMNNTPDPDDVWKDVTPLHVALRHNKIPMAKKIAQGHPQLITQRDMNGETPLHCALVAGYDHFVLWWLEDLTGTDLERGRVLSLEAATLNFLLDSAGRSLLYLAAEKGTPKLVNALLRSPLGSMRSGPNKLTALHAAVLRYDNSADWALAAGIIRALMKHQPQLSREKDVFGNTPLHYAATTDKPNLLDLLLLRADISAAYIRNKEGLSPVHVAASLGLVGTFQRLVDLCPDSGFATTASGSNALHLSVQAQREDMVRHIIKSPELSDILINGKDGDGNTPLNLSLFLPSDKIMKILYESDKLDRKTWNSEGLTFVDMEPIKSTLELTRLPDPSDIRDDLKLHGFGRMKFMRNQKVNPLSDSERERITSVENSTNMLMLVATLIITVTFTAAVTIPGGYNDSEPDMGMATLARSAALKVFLIFDTLSLCFSIFALYRLIEGTIASTPSKMAACAAVSLKLIQLAVPSMLVAFETGIYLVMEAHSRPTAITILVITCLVPLIYFNEQYRGHLEIHFKMYAEYIREYIQPKAKFNQRLADLILKP